MKIFTLCSFILASLVSGAQTGELYGIVSNLDPEPSLLHTELILKDVSTGQNNLVHVIPNLLPMSPLTKSVVNQNDNTFNIIGHDISVDSMFYFDHTYLFRVDIQTGQTQTIEVHGGVHYMEYSCVDDAFYLLHYDYNTDTMRFSKIDAATNNYSVITETTTISLATYSNSSGLQCTALDPDKGHLYFHGHDMPETELERRIYTLDVTNGSIVNSHLITAGTVDDIHQLAFSSVDSSLYALKINYAPNERSLVKVDADNWSTTVVSGTTDDFWYSIYNTALITEDGSKYIIPGGPAYGSASVEFHNFDLTTGAHTESATFFINPGSSEFFAYQCPDSTVNVLEIDQFSCSEEVEIKVESSALIINSDAPLQIVQVYNSLGQLCFLQDDVIDQELAIPLNSNHSMYFIRIQAEQCLLERKIWIE